MGNLNMYQELSNEFNDKFTEIGKDFQKEYAKALKSFDGYDLERDEKYGMIRDVLQATLMDYANSKPKTDMGKVGRLFARIGAAVVSVVKFEFLNRKK